MNKRLVYTIIWLLVISTSWSCEDDDGNETKVSMNNDKESHHTGSDCTSCHRAGGGGEGWFNISGSVYDPTRSIPQPNGKIKIYTEPDGNGSLYATIEIDGNGNFYSTEKIDWEGG